MTSIVDYAGLFPPAGLDLPTTLANWKRYTQSEHAWMLGRLIIPAAKLDEFARLLERDTSAPGPNDDAWRVSAVMGENLDADIDRVFEFNRRFASELEGPSPAASISSGADPADLPDVIGSGGIVIDAIELKAQSGSQIEHAMRLIPEQLEPYIELPIAGPVDVRGLVIALAGTGARAKVRTGGIVPEAFPKSADLARFLVACAAADLPFKATAGLHHPLRAEYPLTYEPGCPRGVMFGFINLIVAAALARGAAGAPASESDLVAVLEETNPRTFVFQDSGLTWRDRRIDTSRLARVRESFAVSFGSCSFEEPVHDLTSMNLL